MNRCPLCNHPIVAGTCTYHQCPYTGKGLTKAEINRAAEEESRERSVGGYVNDLD